MSERMTFEQIILREIRNGRRTIKQIQQSRPMFMRYDIRAAINSLMWRGEIERVLGHGYREAA